MTSTSTDPRIEAYFGVQEWHEELAALRSILLASGLTEEWKWRAPCYTFEGGNIATVGGVKDGCTLGFFKGALLSDPGGILAAPGKNTRSARVIRFADVGEIAEAEPVLKAYLAEAVELEHAGAKVDFKKDAEVDVPVELQDKLDESPAFKAAFEALTPGRQRGWILHFSGAKQSKTRTSRIEKAMPRIFKGKGMHDR